MILSGVMKLLCWVIWIRISILNKKVLGVGSFGGKLDFWVKSRFKHFWKISRFGELDQVFLRDENIVL